MAFSFQAWLAGVLKCVRWCWLESPGGNRSRGLHSGAGGGPASSGLCAGACAGHWVEWACRGAQGSSRRVCAGCRVWGVVRGVRRVGVWRACAGVRAGGGGPCRGARGCARWWACMGLRVSSKRGGAWAGIGDAGLNSHEFARIRIRPEFARIRGPLQTRIRKFKFELSLGWSRCAGWVQLGARH